MDSCYQTCLCFDTHRHDFLQQFEIYFLFSFSFCHVNVGLVLCVLQEEGMKQLLADKQLERC